MFVETQVFENVISTKEQDTILEFMESNHKNWHFYSYVSAVFNPVSNVQFPGYTYNIEKSDAEKFEKIFPILKKIESTVCEKINLKFLQNDRYKLNCQPPVGEYTTDELYRNIHYDRITEHVVLIYYANDSDGDTLLFKNKKGYDLVSNRLTMLEANEGKYENVELAQSITPKKGKAVVFDGKLLHCAGWSKVANRYVVNLNMVLDNNKKRTNLI